MSVSPSSIPDPSFYSYTPSLPTGINYGDAESVAKPAAASSSSSTSATSATPTASVSPYQSAYDSLEAYDDQELLQTSLASPATAQANVASVLAQAASLQAQQTATASANLSAAANSAIQGSPTTASAAATSYDVTNLPTLSSIIGSSDDDANTAIDNLVNNPGSSILDVTA